MGDLKKTVLSLPRYIILISILFFSLAVITGCSSRNSTSPATGAGTGTGTEADAGTGAGTGTETGTETGAGTETETPLSAVPTPPLIGDLTFTPSEIIQQGGGGAYSVTGSVSFLDRNGDVTKLTIEVFNNTGTLVKTIEQDTSVSGTASGNIDFIFYVDSSVATANYSFKIYVTDAADHTSNTLTGKGNETGNLNSPPVIGNLGFDPITATGVLPGLGGGSSSIKGSVDFLDIESEVSTLIINLYDYDSGDLVSTLNQSTGVFGESSGSIGFEIFVDNYMNDNTPGADHTKLYKLEAHVIDSSGLASNTVTHNINVGVVHPVIGNAGYNIERGTAGSDGKIPITISGSVMSWDDDADVESITLTVRDASSGDTVYVETKDAGVYGTSDNSMINFSFSFKAFPMDVDLEIFVTDALFLDSNILGSGITYTAPIISDVNYAVTKGTVANGQLPITISGSLMTWDADADITDLMFQVANESGDNIYTNTKDAVATGQDTFSYTFNIPDPGATHPNITFSFKVIDAASLSSNEPSFSASIP